MIRIRFFKIVSADLNPDLDPVKMRPGSATLGHLDGICVDVYKYIVDSIHKLIN